jgi:hypothetical protein
MRRPLRPGRAGNESERSGSFVSQVSGEPRHRRLVATLFAFYETPWPIGGIPLAFRVCWRVCCFRFSCRFISVSACSGCRPACPQFRRGVKALRPFGPGVSPREPSFHGDSLRLVWNAIARWRASSKVCIMCHVTAWPDPFTHVLRVGLLRLSPGLPVCCGDQ